MSPFVYTYAHIYHMTQHSQLLIYHVYHLDHKSYRSINHRRLNSEQFQFV